MPGNEIFMSIEVMGHVVVDLEVRTLCLVPATSVVTHRSRR